MKRPGAARGGGGGAPPSSSLSLKGNGSSGVGKTGKKNNKPSSSSSNLLGNILGNIKKTSEQQQKNRSISSGGVDANGGGPSRNNRAIDRSSLMTPQERALEQRKKFEKEVREKIESEVVEKWEAKKGEETVTFRCVFSVSFVSSKTFRLTYHVIFFFFFFSSRMNANGSFQPMVKMWRDVAHGCASELHITSESIEIDDVMDEDGDPMKFVRVYKLSKREEEEKKQLEISLREKAEKAKREMLAFRKKESLTDKAPAFGDALSELRVAREGEKRDKRSVEETIADMRKAKEG